MNETFEGGEGGEGGSSGTPMMCESRSENENDGIQRRLDVISNILKCYVCGQEGDDALVHPGAPTAHFGCFSLAGCANLRDAMAKVGISQLCPPPWGGNLHDSI